MTFASDQKDANATAVGKEFPMKPWRLLKRMSDPNKFRILHLLAEEPRSPKTLAKRTGLSASTIRSELRSLRDCHFVEGRGTHWNRRYRIAEELPSVIHELVLSIVLLSEVPIEARPTEGATGLPRELVESLQDRAFKEITKTLLDQLFVYQGAGRRLRKTEELREILRDINDPLHPDDP